MTAGSRAAGGDESTEGSAGVGSTGGVGDEFWAKTEADKAGVNAEGWLDTGRGGAGRGAANAALKAAADRR